jgi:spore coat protein A
MGNSNTPIACRLALFAGRILVGVAALGSAVSLAVPLPGGSLNPTTIPKYVTPLVIPPVMKNTGTANDYDIAVRQFKQQILPGGIWNTLNGRTDAFPATTIWSYGPAADPLPDSTSLGGGVGVAPAPNSQFNYPAYTIENTVNTPSTVDWINGLKESFGAGPKYLPHLLPVDQTLHWANPSADCISGALKTDCRGYSGQPYTGPVPIVTHVHGSHSDPEDDGYAEAWWLPDPTGSNFSCVTDPAKANDSKYLCTGTLANKYGAGRENTNVGGRLGVGQFQYRNDQPSATVWYHDHALGMTRSNVYAGPAGFWLIRTSGGGETGLISGTLPGPAPVYGETLATTNLPASLGGSREKYREIPIAIQDRSLNTNGSLFYPNNRAFFEGVSKSGLSINFIPQSDISPIWNPEFFGNMIVVNGTTWPQQEVAQAEYRFRLLDGCNSRFLNLSMFQVNPGGTLGAEVPFYQIGAEQSLLPNVVKIETGQKTTICQNSVAPCTTPGTTVVTTTDPQEALLMGLAERADVIVDFRGLANGTVVRMINTAPDAPFGGFPDVPADAGTTGQVMQFVVNAALNGKSPTDPVLADGTTPNPNQATPPSQLVLSLVDAAQAAAPSSRTRDLALLEEESLEVCVVVKPTGKIQQLRNVMPGPNFLADCTAAGGVPFAPREAVLGKDGSSTPVVTMWADPVVTNPLLNATETWELWNYTADAHPIHLHEIKFKVVNRQPFGGTAQPPQPTEAAWKDSVIAYPGEVTRVKALFDIAGLYVWHCHIVEHEDNEMMVPYCVGSPSANGCQNLTFDPGA